MIDIVGAVKEIFAQVIEIIFLFFKIPAMIWFEYVPPPMRYFVYVCVIGFSFYMIYWVWKHRFEWLHVYNY